MKYSVLAYYVFTNIAHPEQEVKRHKNFLKTIDSKGRIYIGKEGVNAQLSVIEEDLNAYLDWLKASPIYKGANIKIHHWDEHPFAKLTVKVREQIVALDAEVDVADGGYHLSPLEWKERLEKKEQDTILIDVRNNYESRVGHFKGAICPDLETFREFPKYVKDLAKEYDPKKTRVMMYCTGGIRCELYSSLMKKEGFEDVAQLDGGVIAYGLQEGNKHWKGKLFVFDDRMAVPISEDKVEPISSCHFCDAKSDTFYNCANMDCNFLFTACPTCAKENKGCCSSKCLETGRVRDFAPEENPKPFRKLPFEEKVKIKK